MRYILPILFLPTLALAQGTPWAGKETAAQAAPEAAKPAEVVAEMPRVSAEMETLAKGFMDCTSESMNLKMAYSRLQRNWDDMCKAHADLKECKKP